MKNLINLKIQYAWKITSLFFLLLLFSLPSATAFSKKLDINTETTKTSEVLFIETDTSLLDLIMQNHKDQIACLEQSYSACYFESFTSYCTKTYDWLMSEHSVEMGTYFVNLNKLIPKASTFVNLQDGQDINDLRFSDNDAQQILSLSLDLFKFYLEKGLYNYENQDSIRLTDRTFTDNGVLISETKQHEGFTPLFSKEFTKEGNLEEFYWNFHFNDDSTNDSQCILDYKKIFNKESAGSDEIIQELLLPNRTTLSYRSYRSGLEELSIQFVNAFDLKISLKNGKLSEQSLRLDEGCSDMGISIYYKYPIFADIVFKNGILECTDHNMRNFYDFKKMEYGSMTFNDNGDTIYLELKKLKNKNIEDEDGFIKFKIHFDCQPHVEFLGMNYLATIRKQWSEDWDVDSGKKVYYLSEEEYRESGKDVYLRTRYWPNGEIKSKSKY